MMNIEKYHFVTDGISERNFKYILIIMKNYNEKVICTKLLHFVRVIKKISTNLLNSFLGSNLRNKLLSGRDQKNEQNIWNIFTFINL